MEHTVGEEQMKKFLDSLEKNMEQTQKIKHQQTQSTFWKMDCGTYILSEF